MDKQSYESLIQQEIADTLATLIPHGGGATVTEVRLRSALAKLAQRVASHTRAYELLGIRTSDELATEWGVSKRRVQTFIAQLHERSGVGRKIGRDWVLSADEAEHHRPGAPGRPPNKGIQE